MADQKSLEEAVTNVVGAGTGPATVLAAKRLAASVDPDTSRAWGARQRRIKAEANRPVTIVLPSNEARTDEERAENGDITVDVVRMPIKLLWERGTVPSELGATVQAIIDQLESRDPEYVRESTLAAFEQDPIKVFNQWLDLLYFVWLENVVSPAFVDDRRQPADGKRTGAEEPPFAVQDVDYNDLLFVYQWSQGVDQSVREFLLEQTAALGAVGTVGEGGGSGPVLRIDRRGGRVVGVEHPGRGASVGDVRGAADEGDEGGDVQEAEEREAEDPGAEVLAEADQRPHLRPVAGQRRGAGRQGGGGGRRQAPARRDERRPDGDVRAGG
jgi:hypothetical protein